MKTNGNMKEGYTKIYTTNIYTLYEISFLTASFGLASIRITILKDTRK